MTWRARMLSTCLLAACLFGAAPSAPVGGFRALELWIDAGPNALGAYQVEIELDGGRCAGFIGGSAAAFAVPPFYDLAALDREAVILAGYALDDDRLPRGRVHVATISVQSIDRTTPAVRLVPIVAGDASGRAIAFGAEARWGDGS